MNWCGRSVQRIGIVARIAKEYADWTSTQFCAGIQIPPHTYMTNRMEKADGSPFANDGMTPERAYVLFRGSPDEHRIDYALEKAHGTWKLAGVVCVDTGIKFNIP